MQTKVYFASSVPAALEAARAELGPDALLVNSRPSPPEGRAYGRLEVTFAFEQKHEAPRPIAPPAERHSTPNDMRTLTARIPVAPFVEMKPGDSRIIAFVGPPGRGKTTSLVKLAVGQGLARRVPVRIYSAGAHGVGAQEQMARYAAILGVPHQAFESTRSLALALTGDGGWRGLSLIDTPGFSPSDHQDLRDFGAFFAGRSEIETNLVLRAEGRSADHLATIERFSGFKLSRLLFTGTDEMTDAAAMVDTLTRANIAATFVGTGPQIPDGLEEIDAGRLVRGMVNRRSAERFALAAA